MSDDAANGIGKSILQVEQDAARSDYEKARAGIIAIAEDTKVCGITMVDEDPVGLFAVAIQLERSAVRLRTLAIELNSSDLRIRESIETRT